MMSEPLIHIPRRLALLFAGFLVLYEFLTYIANDMFMPGMLSVVASFHANESAIASSFTAYVLGGASLQLLLGPISDCYGRRPVMLFGAFFFLMMTILIALSQSMNQFLWARFFQGMGLCFICVVGYATLQELFAEMAAIRLIAVMANVSILAPLLGPLLGVFLIQYVSWRWLFLITALFALCAFIGLWRFMPEPIGALKRDGQTIKAVSLAPRVIFANYKALLCNRSFLLGSLSIGLLGLPCCLWIAFSPVILVEDAQLPMMQYGLWQVPIFGSYILGNVVLKRLTHRLEVRDLCQWGTGVAMFGLMLMAGLPWCLHHTPLALMPGLVVYFFGYGLLGAPLNRFVLYSTAVAKGTGSALLSMFSMAVMGFGTEGVNQLAIVHDLRYFGIASVAIGAVACLFVMYVFRGARFIR